jgi:hypothetical protein
MKFDASVDKFNKMYGLPCGAVPTQTDVGDAGTRLANFRSILTKELSEEDALQVFLGSDQSDAAKLAEVADWLGDIVVYAASEMRRFVLPINDVLAIIMESNYSKLDENGNPILDERGYVGKGPNYWKPEPKLRALFEELIAKS